MSGVLPMASRTELYRDMRRRTRKARGTGFERTYGRRAGEARRSLRSDRVVPSPRPQWGGSRQLHAGRSSRSRFGRICRYGVVALILRGSRHPWCQSSNPKAVRSRYLQPRRSAVNAEARPSSCHQRARAKVADLLARGAAGTASALRHPRCGPRRRWIACARYPGAGALHHWPAAANTRDDRPDVVPALYLQRREQSPRQYALRYAVRARHPRRDYRVGIRGTGGRTRPCHGA